MQRPVPVSGRSPALLSGRATERSRADERASERAGGQARGAARPEETKGILFSGFSLAFAFFAGGATFGGEGVAAIRIKPIVPAGQREKGREERNISEEGEREG